MLCVKKAQLSAERTVCRQRVRRAYFKKGLIDSEDDSVALMAYYHPHKSLTCYAEEEGRMVATISGVFSERMGDVPLDQHYPDAMEALRQKFGRLCEVGLFADVRKVPRFQDLFQLISLLVANLLEQEVYGVAMGVHPNAVGFYERFFGCTQIGERKAYSSLNDAEVVLLACDFRSFDLLPTRFQYQVELFRAQMAPYPLPVLSN
ncbi:MAG TPA: hypothetical protein DCR93_25240 [Cytophagales bacterium]|nr:hypothetical protein [Cytophagales bacterium]